MYLLMARLWDVGRRRGVVVLGVAFVLVIAVGGELFALAEGLPFTTGLYWAITTATTVGYGDVIAHNPAGRVIASAVMLTAIPMLGSLFAVVTGATVSSGIRRIMHLDSAFPAGTYRLVIGMHPTVPAVLAELADARDAVVLVADVDPTTMPSSVHLIKGDPTDPGVIARARPEGAQHALVTGASDGDVLVSTILLRRLAPNVPVCALSGSNAVREALDDLGVQQTLAVDDLVAHTLAKSLETPHAGGLIEELVDSDDCTLVEVVVDDASVGRRLSEIRLAREGLVLGLVHGGDVSLGIADDPTAAAGDRLMIAIARTAGNSPTTAAARTTAARTTAAART